MERIRCELGERADALEDVRAAVALCRERGAELEFVAIVRTSSLDPPQPAFGERVRRFKHVQGELREAVRIARSAGLTPTVAIREAKLERGPLKGWAGAIVGAPARLAGRRRTGAGNPALLERSRLGDA
jgi:hypothetical protein